MTSSPYKRELQEEEEQKQRKTKRKLEVAQKGVTKKATKKAKNPTKKKSQKARNRDSSEEDDTDSTGVLCLYCTEAFSRSAAGEGWARCSQCRLWAHDLCAGLGDDDDEFNCDLCL